MPVMGVGLKRVYNCNGPVDQKYSIGLDIDNLHVFLKCYYFTDDFVLQFKMHVRKVTEDLRTLPPLVLLGFVGART